jgi:hypothetical protein
MLCLDSALLTQLKVAPTNGCQQSMILLTLWWCSCRWIESLKNIPFTVSFVLEVLMQEF